MVSLGCEPQASFFREKLNYLGETPIEVDQLGSILGVDLFQLRQPVELERFGGVRLDTPDFFPLQLGR